MKKLIVFLMSLTLSLQGFAAAPDREPAAYNIDRAQFSSLILNAEQLGRLSPADRTVYLMNIMTLVQLIETSQSRFITKVSNAPLKPPKKKKTAEAETVKSPVPTEVAAAKTEVWYQLFVHQAEAAIKLALTALSAVGSRLAPVFGALSRFKPALGTGAEFKKATELLQRAIQANAKAESVFAKTAGVATTAGSAAVKAARTEMVAGVDAFVAAQKAFTAAKKVAAPDSALFKQSKKAMEVAGGKMLSKVQKLYKSDPAQEAVFRKEFRDTLAKAGAAKPSAVADYSWKAAKGLGTGYTGYEVGKLAEPYVSDLFVGAAADEGKPSDAAPAGDAPAAEATGSAADASAPATGATTAAAEPEAAAQTGNAEAPKSGKQTGGVCIYGGNPSQWTRQKSGKVTCPQPAGTACGDVGYYQCPTYGLSIPAGPLQSELCEWPHPLENLTYRCGEKLKKLIQTKAPQADAPITEAALAEVRAALVQLEGNPEARDESGKPLSIGQYCATDATDQAPECGVIRAIIDSLKQIEGIPAAVAENVNAAAQDFAKQAAEAAAKAAGAAVETSQGTSK